MRPIPDDFRHLPSVDEEPLEDLEMLSSQAPPAWEEPAQEAHEYEHPAEPKIELEAEPEPEAVPEEVLVPVPQPARPQILARVTIHEDEAPEDSGNTTRSVLPRPPAPLAAPAPEETESLHDEEPPLPSHEPDSTEKEVPHEPAEAPAQHGPDVKTAAPTPAEEESQKWWEKWGGRSLLVSIGVHALLLTTGALVVVHQVMDAQVDFLPGGSEHSSRAAEQLQHKIQQKKNPWITKATPVRKLAVENSLKDIILPTETPDMLDLPMASKPLGGGMLGGLGGAGGGFNKGNGLGGQTGMVFGPLFGMNIRAKKLAVVLDVSLSMEPHLQRVVAEVDKVARGSVVVLFYGCGLEAPPPKGLTGTRVFRTSGVEFEKYWRLEHSYTQHASFEQAGKYRINPKDPIPNEDLFRMLSRRPLTYFIHWVDTNYTWLALLSDEVRNADGIYWFSDFQDKVSFSQIEVVHDNLKARRQRLYIHSYGKGQSFDLVKNQLVVPTQGDSFIEE